jgi:hypothetical protein
MSMSCSSHYFNIYTRFHFKTKLICKKAAVILSTLYFSLLNYDIFLLVFIIAF